MTLDADKQITELAREIIRDAGKPYTPEQLAVLRDWAEEKLK